MISVLLVDDDEDLLDLARRVLGREEDLELFTTTSTSEGHAMLLSKEYDAVVLDYEMPGMDGLEFLREMKARKDETPVIIFTGKGREEVVIEALNNGADFYLQKSGDPRMNFLELIYMIREAVRRHRFSRELAESERRFREALERLKLIAFQIDREGHITFCNDYLLGMSGWDRDEVIGADWIDIFVPGEEKAAMEKLFSKAFHDEPGGENFPCPFLTREGQLRQVVLNNTPLRDPLGNVCGLSCIGEDITERRKSEEERRSSEERLQILFDYAPDAYFLSDLSGNFIDCNRAAEELLGYRRDEILEKNLFKSGILTPEHIPRGISLLARHIEGVPTGPEELVLIRNDGRGVVVEMRHYPVTIGNKCLVLGSVHDITDRKMAEDSLRRVNAKLTLLNSITRHDILNTLTALLLYIELLKEDPKDESQKEIFEKVEMLTQTIKKQIEFTRTYQDIGIYAPQWQSLESVTRRAAASIDMGSVKFVADIDDLEIYADPLLEHVISNLIDNSLRHGEHVTTIWLTSIPDENGTKIIYEDNGVGIPGKEKEEIFKRGYGRNTGFGLFLSREILNITGITIKETGTPGKGSRFEIRVPFGNFRVRNESEGQ
jgi:PAS domain S-box-containing protein